MASAFTHTSIQPSVQAGLAVARTGLGQASGRASLGDFVIPGLLNCLVLSWSEQRAQLLRSVARDETWQAKVCGDVQEFLRSVFQLEFPLTIVDLPREESTSCEPAPNGSAPNGSVSYEELKEIATQTCGLNHALLVVCGAEGDRTEEQWVRQIGAWAYLPGTSDPEGLRLVFAEARKALAKQSSIYMESSGYRESSGYQ